MECRHLKLSNVIASWPCPHPAWTERQPKDASLGGDVIMAEIHSEGRWMPSLGSPCTCEKVCCASTLTAVFFVLSGSKQHLLLLEERTTSNESWHSWVIFSLDALDAVFKKKPLSHCHHLCLNLDKIGHWCKYVYLFSYCISSIIHFPFVYSHNDCIDVFTWCDMISLYSYISERGKKRKMKRRSRKGNFCQKKVIIPKLTRWNVQIYSFFPKKGKSMASLYNLLWFLWIVKYPN